MPISGRLCASLVVAFPTNEIAAEQRNLVAILGGLTDPIVSGRGGLRPGPQRVTPRRRAPQCRSPLASVLSYLF
jgi:hypothetical protein